MSGQPGGAKPIAVVTTVATREQARRLARMAVERRLAACVQISAIDSVYAWQGQLHEEPELRLLFKTTAERWDALAAAILELHPYELPELHTLDFERVHAPYAEWLAASCRDDAPPAGGG